jgi:hypothetical protein
MNGDDKPLVWLEGEIKTLALPKDCTRILIEFGNHKEKQRVRWKGSFSQLGPGCVRWNAICQSRPASRNWTSWTHRFSAAFVRRFAPRSEGTSGRTR